MSDPPPACPECGFADVRKRVSKTTFQLKGTGWYVTDYKSTPGSGPPESSTKNTGASASNGTSSSKEAKSEAKSETKSEAKSEAKSETKSKSSKSSDGAAAA